MKIFWIPSNPKIKVIVVCDTFDYHSDKDTFISDRKRDRELQTKWYLVFRFSGSVIYNDPITASLNLLNF